MPVQDSVVDYLFVPYLARGHVNPMLAVAAELVRRGDRVGFVVSDDFAREAAGVGCWVLPVPRHRVRVPATWRASELADRMRVLLRRWWAWASAIRAVRRSLVTDRPDVFVADVRLPWIAPVASRLGVPLVGLCTTRATVVSRRHPVLVNAPPELQPATRRLDRTYFVAPLVRADEQEPTGMSMSGHHGPILLVAAGTVFARTPAFFRRVIDEFGDSDWLVLMATGQTPVHELGALPVNVIARRWLPQRTLLRSTTVMLGHGGMNSVQEALLAGVPMILAPRSREQRLTTRRLIELGLAIHADDGAYRAHAEQVANHEPTRAACRSMRERLLRRSGTELAADVLAGIARPDVPDRSRRAT